MELVREILLDEGEEVDADGALPEEDDERQFQDTHPFVADRRRCLADVIHPHIPFAGTGFRTLVDLNIDWNIRSP